VRGWDINTHDGIERALHYKARIRAKSLAVTIDRGDVDMLCEQIMRRKPIGPPRTTDAGRALVVNLADLQAGKAGEAGGGTPEMVTRVCAAFDAVAARIVELRRAKRPVDEVYIVGMGDLLERCQSGHGTQMFTLDLDEREQYRIVRRLILRLVDLVAPLVPKVTLSGVPGNHGENRGNAGKMVTRPSDNADLAVIEQVAEVLTGNPDRYGHVVTVFPEAWTLTLAVAGVPVAWVHGQGTASAPKMEEWWRGQALGSTGVAGARILVSAHYHHFRMSEATGRTWLQCPALDGGSNWFSHRTGASSPPGLLTFVAGEGCGARGWSDLAIL